VVNVGTACSLDRMVHDLQGTNRINGVTVFAPPGMTAQRCQAAVLRQTRNTVLKRDVGPLREASHAQMQGVGQVSEALNLADVVRVLRLQP